MNIIIAGTAYPMRGAFAQLNAMLYSYLSERHNVKVYSFKRQYPELLFPGKTQIEKSEELVKIPKERNIIAIDSINPFNWINTGRKIAKEKPDLVIFRYWIPFFAPSFSVISFVAKLLSKTKVLFICDNVIPHEKRFGDTLLTKIAFSQADFFVIQSKSVEDELKQFNKNKPYKLSPHPIYNVYGDKLPKDDAKDFIKNEYGFNLKGEKVILFFGYIRKYKGLYNLIDAMPAILKEQKVKLLVVGEFYEDENKYREQIKNLGLEKDVLVVSDFVPNDKVRYFFSACDAIVLPYVSATQSGIIQIAYYYDKPVIATNVGGLSEVVINNSTGFIIKPGSIEEIASAVKKFYNEGLENEFTENVKIEKKKYEWDSFVNDIEELAFKNK